MTLSAPATNRHISIHTLIIFMLSTIFGVNSLLNFKAENCLNICVNDAKASASVGFVLFFIVHHLLRFAFFRHALYLDSVNLSVYSSTKINNDIK